MNPGWENFGARWTAEHDDIIRRNYKTKTDREIAAMIPGRNRKSVHQRRDKLGLLKYGPGRAPDIQIVHRAAAGMRPCDVCPIALSRAEMREIEGMSPEAAMLMIMERRGYL